MELYYSTYFGFGDDLENCSKKTIEINYSLNWEDLEEFVKEQEYKSVKEYVGVLSNLEGEELEEELKDIENVEFYIRHNKYEKEAFERFIISKYKEKIEKELFEKLINEPFDFEVDL